MLAEKCHHYVEDQSWVLYINNGITRENKLAKEAGKSPSSEDGGFHSNALNFSKCQITEQR